MKRVFIKLLHAPILVECGNLPDALTLLKQEQFDFALLDINMPDGDSSPNVVREILSIHPDIKVCLCSGNDKAQLEQSYLEAGAVGFVQKDENMTLAVAQVLKNAFN